MLNNPRVEKQLEIIYNLVKNYFLVILLSQLLN